MFFCEYCEIFKKTYFEKHLRRAASESGFTYQLKGSLQCPHFNIVLSTKERRRLKRCKGNVDLLTVLKRCSDVLITTLFYKQHNDVFPTS